MRTQPDRLKAARLAACVAVWLLFADFCAALAQERVTLRFYNADIDSVVRAIGHYTGRTFVVDPRVKGTLSLVSEKPMSKSQALAALTAALRLRGYAIVEVGGVSRVVPEADAKFQGGPVDTSAVPSGVRGDQVQTQVFRLQYEPVANVLQVVRPLVSPSNPVTAYASTNALVVTDYADNLRRIEQVIAALDRPPTSDTEVIAVKNAIASDLAMIVIRITDQPGTTPDPLQKVTVMADPGTNSLVVRTASATTMQMVRALVDRLDQPSPPGQNVYVVPMRNMEAAALAKTLSAVAISDAGPALRPVSTAGGQVQAAAGAGGAPTIVADPATNSLVINASESAYRQLRAVMDKLDVRRAQVFIEALLAEVRTDRAVEFGIQWQTGLDKISSDSAAVAGGTNFGGPSQNIVSGAQNLANLGRGLNIGIINGTVNVPGLGTITNLNVLARALETIAKANILSTPNILTLDNEEARFVVGQNIPIITGQFVPQTGGATVTPFQTIERRDIGLTIKVRPQISEGGTVRLNIYQEVSSILDTQNPAGIITTMRSLQTTALVDDGSIVVLGGLIQDQLDNVVEKVPVLGDIPLLGALFRYDTRRRQKTNLMLFLRPHLIHEESAVRVLTNDRYDFIRKLEQSTQTTPQFGIPRMEGPVVPELPARSEQPSPQPAPRVPPPQPR